MRPANPPHMTEESTKNAAKIAFGIGIFLIMPGLPLLIIGSTSTGEDRLAMIIPGAILTGIGSLALIILLMIWGAVDKGNKRVAKNRVSIF